MTEPTTLSDRVEVDQLAGRAGRREWIGLAVIALPCLLYSMDLTVLNLAVPSLAADLQPTSSQLLWIVDIYGFFVAGSLVTMGTLGDRIGRRRLLLIGAAAFGLLSVGAAFAPTAEALIVVRALLGVAGATLAPSTLSLIRNMFDDPHQRTFAIGIWIASFSAGAALGPVLGGVLLDRFWWGSVFLLAVPVMALLLVLGPILLPEFRDPNAGRLDLVSAALSLLAVLFVIYGIKELAQQGWSITPAVAVTVGAAIGLVFVRRQQTLAHPFIDLRLFQAPAFRAALGVNTFSFVGLTGAFLFTAQYFQLVAGLSPLQAGLWGLPSAAAFVIGSLFAPQAVRRFRPAVVVSVSLAVAAVGFAMLTRADGGELPALVAGSVLFALALTPVITLSTDMVVTIAPPERAGAAAALSETSVEFGGALGIAILGSIGTSVYRARITDALPASLSPDATGHAGDTLAGALTAAADLPGRAGADLVGAARDAFVQGMHVAVAVGAGLTLTIAVIAAVFLRRVDGETADVESTLSPSGHPQPGGACTARACAACG